MIPIYRKFRVYMTRTFLALLGLRVGYWRQEVKRLWSLSADQRIAELDSILSSGNHKATDGTLVRNVADLSAVPFMLKKDLQRSVERTSPKSTFHRFTAGTTGEPTHIRLNRQELGRMLGVRDYCYRHCGICVGEREGRLWAREGTGIKERVKTILLNRRIFHPAGINKDTVVKQLIKWKPAYLYGYSSLLLECARIVEDRGWSISNLRCVICTAENILPSQKQYLERVFKSPVFEEYGSTEFDIIAFDCSQKERHIVNPWLNVSTTDDDILYITDVSRKSQSIIKYLIGDAAQLIDLKCDLIGSNTVVQTLLGRSQDRLAYIDPESYFHAVEFAHAIDGYQKATGLSFSFTVYQERYAEFMLDLTPAQSVSFQNLKNFIEKYINNVTGSSITVIQYLDASRPEKDLSKRSYFIQNVGSQDG